MRQVTVLLACLASCLLGFDRTYAGVMVPAGLGPGDIYHFVFTTQGRTFATDPDIGFYDSFVQSEAERAGAITSTLGIRWRVIGSTPTVEARSHALVQGPVFKLDGTQVANGFEDIWDRSIDSPMNLDQFGAESRELVATGTTPEGLRKTPSAPLFTLGGSAVNVSLGTTTLTDSSWIDETSRNRQRFDYVFYALSEPIVVVPEPASLTIFSIGGLTLTGYRRRRAAG